MSYVDLLKFAIAKPSLEKRTGYPRHLLFLFALITAAAVSGLNHGQVKSWAELNWIDIVGEGATCAAFILWLHFIIAKRPPGPVTLGLGIGFAALCFSFAMDFLDELVKLDNQWWGKAIEPVSAPLAMVILSFAMFGLYREQRILGRQQWRREANFRDHSAIDPTTDLYDANYFRSVLDTSLAAAEIPQVLLVDLMDFDRINQRYGFKTGDQVLNRVAHTLVATMPSDSLVCRYSGDRFAILTPAKPMAPELDSLLERLLSSAMTTALYQSTEGHFECPVRVISTEPHPKETADQALRRANALIEAIK